MIKGDKIKLTKPMGVFTNVGEVCEVTDIMDGGVICFRFGGYHLGCMSYDEYLKYFEPVVEVKPRKWTEWTLIDIDFYDPDYRQIAITAKFRHNNKKVQIRWESLRAESSCCAEDTFDLNKGLHLAKSRLIVKYLDHKVRAMAKNM